MLRILQLVILVVLGAASSGWCQTPSAASSALDVSLISIPLERQVPFTKALSDIDVRVQKGYVLFGVELNLIDDKEPVVNLDLEPGSTLGQAVRQIVQQLPGYDFESVSDHLMEIFRRGAKKTTNNLLNVRASRFDVENAQASAILTRPRDFIPELWDQMAADHLGPPRHVGRIGGITDTAPPINLHLRNVTVRQILDAVSEATENYPANDAPLGWVFTTGPNVTKVPKRAARWAVLWSVPSNWKSLEAR